MINSGKIPNFNYRSVSPTDFQETVAAHTATNKWTYGKHWLFKLWLITAIWTFEFIATTLHKP